MNFEMEIQRNIDEILLLPYKDREKPANNVFNGLLLLGYDAISAKRLMRGMGMSRRLLFLLKPHEHL